MSRQPAKVRILLVDDHALFREGVARMLAAEPDFEVVGHSASVKSALEIVASRPVDVVLLDLDLGDHCGADFLSRAAAAGFSGRVLVLTGGLSDEEAAKALQRGASGIFLKHNPPELLVKSIRKVMTGELWLDQRFVHALLCAAAAPKPAERQPALTQRELEVLRAVFEGLTNKEIADRLHSSETSVKATLQQLFNKTGVRTRSQLVRVALEQYRDQL